MTSCFRHISMAAVALLAACTSRTPKSAECIINGQLEPTTAFAWGDTVYLSRQVGDEQLGQTPERIDTAVVCTDGSFCFHKVPDTVGVYFVELFHPLVQEWLSCQVFLEQGTITYTQSPVDWQATGTPLNDTFTAIRHSVTAGHVSIQDFWLQTALAGAHFKEADAAYKPNPEHLQGVLERQVATHQHSPVAPALLHLYKWDIRQHASLGFFQGLLPLLQQMHEPNASTPAVKIVKEYLEALVNVLPGKPYADFTLPTPDGTPMSLSQIVGKHKLVLLNFWASWCAPCHAYMPIVKQTYAQYKDKGLEIVGISIDTDQDKWKQDIAAQGLAWPQVCDLQGWQSPIARHYGVRQVPIMVFIDDQGRIVEYSIDPANLLQIVAKLMEE